MIRQDFLLAMALLFVIALFFVQREAGHWKH